jgi:hypothetical protein
MNNELRRWMQMAELLAARLEETKAQADKLGPVGAEFCGACGGTGEDHEPDCPILLRQKANDEALTEFQALKDGTPEWAWGF